MKIPKTTIEVTDVMPDPEHARCHKTREYRVNGVPVLLAEDGFWIDHGPNQATVVHLEILATEIHFQAATPYEEEAKKGDVIGYAGRVDLVASEHLHFERGGKL